MEIFSCYGKKIQDLCSGSCLMLACLCKPFLLFTLNSFTVQLLYFLALSSFGFLLLRGSDERTGSSGPRNIDLFFTSVSAATVSSMSVVEMEVFSNTQLVFLTLLMFVGGEVFTSMVGLHFTWFRLRRDLRNRSRVVNSVSINSSPSNLSDSIELGTVTDFERETVKTEVDSSSHMDLIKYLKYKSIKFLGFVVLGYLLVVHVTGVSLVLVYFSIISSAKDVLKAKRLKLSTFSTFTIVSTFASCGFVPTNENMVVFRKNSGLLWMLIPQVLLGNTLFPSFLRLSVWVLGRFVKRTESVFLLNNTEEIGYLHLLPSLHSSMLPVTVVGFILLQFGLFCALDWKSTTLSGMSPYEKVVGVLFQTVNTRHTGETIVDISAISQAVLVLFVVMMYLPPYTSFLPVKEGDGQSQEKVGVRRKRRGKMAENIILSQLSYLAIFVILICITERESIREDPLNFSVLNIVVEVVSAYGNVGFSTGYSCARQLKPGGNCQDRWFGFSGRWSDRGKLILICVMFFGRLKKFNMDGGRGWKLL